MKLEYKVKFYKNSQNHKDSILEYVEKLDKKIKTKIIKMQ